ncbi:MAG TPA: hypothetical protein VHH36_09735, partial [Candidatus Thermoplasmatota archaeon]|nr:hypothetical protein [Candidatus Thermoplasmatota archaeon]
MRRLHPDAALPLSALALLLTLLALRGLSEPDLVPLADAPREERQEEREGGERQGGVGVEAA